MSAENNRRPKEGWKQLNFKTIICLPSPKCAAIFFMVIFIVSLVLTCVILVYSSHIVEKSVEINNPKMNEHELASIELDDSIRDQVYVYIIYSNYYQCHRIYLKSKSRYQMSGNHDGSLSSNCAPLQKYGDLRLGIHNVSESDVIVPCGIMPASFIAYSLEVTNNNVSLEIDSNDIAWPTDDSSKYVELSNEYLNITNPHFKVWMRSSLTSTPRKLYGKILADQITQGSLTFNLTAISHNYLGYSPELKIMISTTSSIGGKNYVFGWVFFTVTVASFFWMVFFTVMIKYHKVPTIKEIYQKKSNLQEII
jgi:LEM3 (ligand-effect modulator 3) family / CDC50 family